MKNRLKTLMPRAPCEAEFFFKVLLDGVLDLRPPHVVAHSADFLAKPQHAPVVEANVFIARLGVDFRDLKTVLVAGAFARKAANRSAPFLTVTDFSFGPFGVWTWMRSLALMPFL